MFVYLREITELVKLNIRTISSAELGERVSLNDAQVRKDLGYFGQFGVSGSGYDTTELKKALEKILGKDKAWNVAVVGAGHLGGALIYYSGFSKHGFDIVAAFDVDVRKIGKKIGEIAVSSIVDLKKIVTSKKVAIGVITVSAQNAQEVANSLIEAGIECILNFAPINLSVPANIKVRNVDLSHELETLSYFLVNKR